MIKSSLQTYHKVSAVARSALRASERERVSSALTALSAEWKEMLKAAMPTTSRGDLLKALQPGVSAKSGDKKKKNTKKKVAKKKMKVKFVKLVLAARKKKKADKLAASLPPLPPPLEGDAQPSTAPPAPLPPAGGDASLMPGTLVRCIDEAL